MRSQNAKILKIRPILVRLILDIDKPGILASVK